MDIRDSNFELMNWMKWNEIAIGIHVYFSIAQNEPVILEINRAVS